jgi:hypothetical protein
MAALGRSGAVAFVVTESALLVGDQGQGFGKDEIRAICTLGRSSKDPRKSVGYKGLGFKSVGEITDTPEIISSARFRFDEAAVRSAVTRALGEGEFPDGQRLPVYAFPFQLSDDDLGPDRPQVEDLVDSGFTTVMRLPFRQGVERDAVEAQVLDSIRPRLLLFLESIDRLEVRGTESDFAAEAAREFQDGFAELLIEIEGRDQEHWIVWQDTIPVEDRSLLSGLGTAWERVEHVRVGAAIELDDSGRPWIGSPKPIHVYFPTEESVGMPVLLHGDFALDLDRRRIAQAPELVQYNSWLSRHLSDLISNSVVPTMQARWEGDPSLVAPFALCEDPNGFGVELVELIIESLRAVRFVPCVDANSRSPDEVVFLPNSVPSAKDFLRYMRSDAAVPLVHPDLNGPKPIRRLLIEKIGARQLDLSAAAQLLSGDGDFDPVGFFKFLVEWSAQQPRLGKALSDVQCVRTIGGRWTTPSSMVFFPRQRGEIEFPTRIDVPIADLPDIEGLHPLLDEAGVRSFEWRQLVPDFILPILIDDAEDEERRQAALDALRSYYNAERSGDPRIRAQIERVLLPARRSHGGLAELAPAGEIYFSGEWLGDDRLERIYGPFGHREFLAVETLIDADEREAERDFLRWIGVAAAPRVDASVTIVRDRYKLEDVRRHPHRRYGQWWERWWSDPTTENVKKCGQDHPYSQQLRASYGLDRFPDLVEANDPSRLALLWDMLAAEWGTTYMGALTATFFCQNTGHGGERSRPAPSLLDFMLRNAAWVPASRGDDVELAQPANVWRLTRETPRRIANRVPTLPSGLERQSGVDIARHLGVVDAARPSIDDLRALLVGLADEKPTNFDSETEIHHAARWVMRTIDEVLDDYPEEDLRGTPLLAILKREHVFDEAPFMASDEMLKSTFSEYYPVLDADRNLNRLPRAAGLRSLDKEVVTTPRPHGPAEAAEIGQRVRAAGPFMAAVAFKEVQSRRDDVVRGLNRLELVVCERLTLVYELDGQTVEREDATCYVAIRTEQEGRVRRRIGTAYLELGERGEPDWFTFGPELARFLDVPTLGDAFSLLLSHGRDGRQRYLDSKQVSAEEFAEAMEALDNPPLDDVVGSLIDEILGFSSAQQGEGDTESSESETLETGQSTVSESEATPEEEEYPELDEENLRIDEGEVAEEGVGPSDSKRDRRRQSGTGGSHGLPPMERVTRALGHRGEKAVYLAERRRLTSLGLDPEQVRWVSKDRPLSPYDIESLLNGQRVYIEVKATKGSDPFAPFEISAAELIFGLQKRGNYLIDRVTEAHTATPAITRFEDPLGLLSSGSAILDLSSARFAFMEPRPA